MPSAEIKSREGRDDGSALTVGAVFAPPRFVRSFFPAVVIAIAVGFGFYAHRESAPKAVPAVSKWIASAASEDHEVARAGDALKLLRTAADHGLVAENYQEAALEAALDRL